MSILINKKTPVYVIGLGEQGKFHTERMLDYGTNVVAGVDKRQKDGTILHLGKHKVPVFKDLSDALTKVKAELGVVFISPKYAGKEINEALNTYEGDNTIKSLVVITEGIPRKESIILANEAEKNGKKLIGPNCPGIITPGEAYVGVIPASAEYFKPGNIGVISGSGTLLYEIVRDIYKSGFGISTAVPTGGDAIKFTNYADYLELFRNDSNTDAVVLIGEIGGTHEQEAAKFIQESKYTKPVFVTVVGKTAPPGKRMGHAGAVIEGGQGTWLSKIEAFNKAGIPTFQDSETLEQLLRMIKN